MRISVLAVGTRMPSWVTQGVEEYCRRLPRELKLQWREIPLARRMTGSTPEQFGAWLKSESDKWGKIIRERGITAE